MTTFEMSLDQILNLEEKDILPAGLAIDATAVDFNLEEQQQAVKEVEERKTVRQSTLGFEESKDIGIVIEDMDKTNTLEHSNVEYASIYMSQFASLVAAQLEQDKMRTDELNKQMDNFT